jgi:multidrug efflux pump subunit AcrA (membrane-fusion protein)
MKNVTLGAVLLGVLAAGFLAGAWHNQRERVSAASLHGRRVLYYVDPMHPSYKSERPGVAPDCGMALEPIYADGDARAAPRAGPRPNGYISPEKQQLIGVRVSAVEKRSATERLRLYGRVAADEARIYSINVGIDGFIREVTRAATGSHVRKDEWLATFSAPEMRTPIQGYLVTLDVLDRVKKADDGPTTIGLASAGVHQARDRLLTLGMSAEQISEVARTRQVPFHIRIAAPEDGFVTARHVSTGQKFERGDELFRIADLRRVWIVADVFGLDAEYVKAGATADVFLPGRARPFKARVSSDVLPQFDAARQSVSVRLEADNPGYLLRPDMFVDVEVSLALPPSIAIPADAILDAGATRTVFVEKSDGVFEPRVVQTGWRFGGQVEIVRGLDAGERVVVSGAFLLDSDSRMRRVPPGGDPDR